MKLIISLIIVLLTPLYLFGESLAFEQQKVCSIEQLPNALSIANADENPLFYESFEEQFPPVGWTVISNGSADKQWEWSTARARSGSHSVLCQFIQESGTMDEWLITPAIDLSSVRGARLLFWESERYWSYGQQHTIKVSTTSTDPASFTDVIAWTPDLHEVNGFDGKPAEVDLTPFAGLSTVYIAFHYTVAVADLWYIDDVTIVQPKEHDVKCVSMSMDSHIAGGSMGMVQALVENYGLENESFDVQFGYLMWDGTPKVLKTKTAANLAAAQKANISFGFYTMPQNLQYEYFIRTVLAGDMDVENDMVTQSVNSFEATRPMVLIEKGTGTWCQYCPGAALSVEQLGIDYPGKLAVIEYHGGDNYEFPDGRARLNGYKITGYPTAVFNGFSRIVGGSSEASWKKEVYPSYRAKFNAALTHPTCFDIKLQYTEKDGIINAKSEITCSALSYIKDYRLFYAVNESHIAERWQGLDSLQHVARGIYPDLNGKPFIFNQPPDQGVVFSDETEFAMPTGVVQKNCQVLAFVQNIKTLEVLAVTIGEQVEPTVIPFQLVTGDTIVTGETGSELVLDGWIINQTDAEIDVLINRETLTAPEAWSSALCLDLCLAPWIDLAEAKIAAGDSLEFSLHFFTGATPDSGTARLKITDKTSLYNKQVVVKGITQWPTAVEQNRQAPFRYELLDNYPNPFNPTTTISYSLAEACPQVTLQLYSILGEQLEQQPLPGLGAGLHHYSYNASKLAAGVYLYRLVYQTPQGTQRTPQKKLTILK